MQCAMPVTDEDAAIQAIATLDTLSKEQQDAKQQIESALASDEPFIDIHELFASYNTLYFRSLLLPRVEVSWSARLMLCAGIWSSCEIPITAISTLASGSSFQSRR